uniref:Asparagine synthetase domain-containing protein n=1 Tax=Haemonchus placei TaxID=6290 RepID=A0A0N4WZB3_HAEPC
LSLARTNRIYESASMTTTVLDPLLDRHQSGDQLFLPFDGPTNDKVSLYPKAYATSENQRLQSHSIADLWMLLLVPHETPFVELRYDTRTVEKLLLDADDRCFAIRSLFGFDRKPVSQEERDYPLAYGLIVYKNLVQLIKGIREWILFQILFMLSSFYRPQNEYCIAVSGGADSMFKLLMDEVDSCFDNVHVLYLSGVDIPLKTNYEMVEIFKAWNDTVNTEFAQFQKQRVRSKRIEAAPLPLFKSSLSATVPRKAVDRIVQVSLFLLTEHSFQQSSESRDLLRFLRNTSIPDESFWTTLTGNVDKFPLPGGTDAAKWIEYRENYRKNHSAELTQSQNRTIIMRYYLSRYQLWDAKRCHGEAIRAFSFLKYKPRVLNGVLAWVVG